MALRTSLRQKNLPAEHVPEGSARSDLWFADLPILWLSAVNFAKEEKDAKGEGRKGSISLNSVLR